MSFDPRLYRHELDRRSFEALSQFPSFGKVIKSFEKYYQSPESNLDLMSSAVRLGPEQMADIYGLLPAICEKLGIDVPELYYIKSDSPNAMTGGLNSPFIVITSSLVEMLQLDGISAVLAHECGHIACGHTLCRSIALGMLKDMNDSFLNKIPGIRNNFSKPMQRAFILWSRCSEFSADRAAVLCSGTPAIICDSLMRTNGYGDDVDRKAFLDQAVELKKMLMEPDKNRFIEMMLADGEDHPRLAIRVAEAYEWSASDLYKGIMDGSLIYTPDVKPEMEVEEVVATEICFVPDEATDYTDKEKIIDEKLKKVNTELDKYTCYAEKEDYLLAVSIGIITGVMNAFVAKDLDLSGENIGLSHKKVNEFIQRYADERGIGKDRLKDTIVHLEKAFKVAQDNVWNGVGIGVSASNHHLADLAHHPTPVGLLSAIAVQFFRVGTFVNKDGNWSFVTVSTNKAELISIWIPVVVTGVLNWLVAIGEKEYEEENGRELPKAIKSLAHVAASTPLIVEIVKCADNWFGHLVSDMGGSHSTAGGGMGIPGVFVSLLHEVSSLPILKDTALPKIVNDLYTKRKFDLRHELSLYESLGTQAISVIFYEVMTRAYYFISRLVSEIGSGKKLKEIDWQKCIPVNNRTIDRMLTITSMTFNVANTMDASVHALIESKGEAVSFSYNFVKRYNFIGAGRAAVCIFKEISAERKEIQLIHERLLLTELKTQAVVERLEKYNNELEERVSEYLAKDIEEFLNGFAYINKGIESGDSDLVIKGNVIIQRVLGRPPQFTNQEEFDELMDSDEAFVL